MKKWFEQFKTEDWVVVAVSILLLAFAIITPNYLPRIPKHLADTESWGNAIFLFVIVLVILYIGWLLLGRPLKGLFLSLIAVFSVSLLAQITAALPQVSYYGFESVFFSVIFGLIIRNVFRVPAWMKPAIQSEFFIKIGVVCLGATILFSDVMKSGAVGLVQAVLVVSIVWFFAYFISRRLGVDQRSAMILSSGVSICGVSACITAARVAGGDDKKLSYIVSLVLIIVVPMIYMMPWLAHLLLPVLFDDPQVIQGEENFYRAKCHLCHTPTLHTRPRGSVLLNNTQLTWLGSQTIHPYSDFLLHDMGSEIMGVGLNDNYVSGLARGNEWRTTPLWGIGLQEKVNGHTYFLHDGRARNLVEAIMWHGGEGEASKNLFKNMSKDDRDALIAFLNSL